MKLRLLGVWAALLLVPAVPVFVFYLVFNDQNFFELSNPARGIVATGPIAAYVAVVLIGRSLYKQISSLIFPLTPYEEKLIGTAWSFEAHSHRESHRQGSFAISRDDRGRLSLAGNFKMADERNVGTWKSTMTHSENGQLQIVYGLDDAGKGQVRNSTGMLSLDVEPDNPDRMSGFWAVFGDSEAFGNLTCERIRS